MTYREALRKGTECLRDAGISEAENDAWLLLEYVTGMNRAHYFLEQSECLTKEQQTTYEALLRKRAGRIPLQHITGVQSFMGLEFSVNEHVLTPRQDTELLVETALARIGDGMSVLDLCTGSGCIAISMERLSQKKLQVYAADISKKALETAKENADQLGAQVFFYQSDLMESIPGQFDMIVSNPPYIATAEIAQLMPEVREHEPVGALDGHEDGLYFYREIIAQAEKKLKSQGMLLFEIGYDQGAAVSELMVQSGYQKVEIKKDYAGLDRVVLGYKV
ncbi:MAG: peptide chain release factor N(5)-glutamine methyltransferase [Eubacteriales bacterium]|nr:peptide chain release factor N(5)-glutamine methyltransferase [Eubacteriales bacterium]